MIFRCLIVIFICSRVADSFTLEPVDFVDFESFEGVRSYPVLKVSFYNPKSGTKVSANKGEILSENLVKNERSSNVRSVDNVREFTPTSREDIRKMKKLSFHGRSPPATENSRPISRQSPVTQVDFKQRNYMQQQSNAARSKLGSRKVPTKAFSSIDKGFLPLMRPSPINVHRPDPPSFQTMRNYVDYLKMRQKQFFSDLDDTPAASVKQVSGEVDYFVKREQELADELQLRPEHRSVDGAEIENLEAEAEYESEEADQEESKRREKFVPFKMYAQVRHVEAEKHEPRSEAPSPQAKEKLTLEKKNIYYKEEGYEEKEYDHGAEKVESHHRAKRDVSDAPPVALPIVVRNVDHSKSTGEKVTKYLEDLLSESSIYLPDDDIIAEQKQPSGIIYGSIQKKKSYKYPYYNLPDSNTLNTMSAFRYSENIKNFPKAKESLYKYKNVKECQEIDQEVDPIPDDIEEEGKSSKYNESPKRLRNLGDKISCYKKKYFGDDPFDNPLFKEEYVAASIPIPFKDASFLSHQANPLITVYDDVISNIRAAFVDELRKEKEKEFLSSTVPPVAVAEPVPASINIAKNTSPPTKVSGFVPSAVSHLPIFDISRYYPKLNIPPSEPTTTIKNDYDMEFIEIPIIDKNYRNSQPNQGPSNVITNLRPPNLPNEKRRRRNPGKLQITRVYPPSQFFQPPVAQDRNKFKFL